LKKGLENDEKKKREGYNYQGRGSLKRGAERGKNKTLRTDSLCYGGARDGG